MTANSWKSWKSSDGTKKQSESDKSEPVDLDSMDEMLIERDELKAKKKILEGQIEKIDAQIKKAVGAGGTASSTHYSVSYKEAYRLIFDKGKLLEEHPEINESDYLMDTKYLKLNIKRKKEDRA